VPPAREIAGRPIGYSVHRDPFLVIDQAMVAVDD
jgi:hypothetical protein